MFASIIALLNDERAQRGMPPLGFLNPWLYGAARGAFMDVAQGSNPGCGKIGYQASQGWDPVRDVYFLRVTMLTVIPQVTGLGTPNYPALRAAAGLS